MVTLEFGWTTSPDEARRITSERLQTVGDELPEDLPAPHMTPASSVMGEIMFIALRSPSHPPMDLKSTADWTVKRRLLGIPGIADIMTIGGDERQVQLLLDPAALSARGIGVNDVAEAMRGASESKSAGVLVEGSQEILVEGVGRARTAEDFGEVIVGEQAGLPIFARDIGTIRIGEGPRIGAACPCHG